MPKNLGCIVVPKGGNSLCSILHNNGAINIIDLKFEPNNCALFPTLFGG